MKECVSVQTTNKQIYWIYKHSLLLLVTRRDGKVKTNVALISEEAIIPCDILLWNPTFQIVSLEYNVLPDRSAKGRHKCRGDAF